MNGFSPTAFSDYVNERNGIATGNRYKVEIGNNNYGDNLTLLCHTAKIMGKSFNTNTQIYGYGSEYNLPINESFEDLSLSFHCTYGNNYETDGLPEYRFFDKWMKDVINPNNNTVGWKKSIPLRHVGYSKDIYVNLLNNSNDVVWRQKFIASIPLSISDIELSSTGTEILTFDVTFTYDNWIANVK